MGFPLADPIIGLLMTMAIVAVLRGAVRDIFRRLMDVVDPGLVDAAEAALAAEPGVTEVRSVKMRRIGHRLHADAELDIDPATSLADAHRIAHEAEHTLTHAVPKLSSALVHAYPATRLTTELAKVLRSQSLAFRGAIPRLPRIARAARFRLRGRRIVRGSGLAG